MTAPLWASTAISSSASITNLGHIEWCNFLEANIPLGVTTQAQKQILLAGYPDILWAVLATSPFGENDILLSFIMDGGALGVAPPLGIDSLGLGITIGGDLAKQATIESDALGVSA